MKILTNITFLIFLSSLLAGTACKKKKEHTEQDTNSPASLTISTRPVTSATDVFAISGGAILSTGSSAVTEMGICYDTLTGPDLQHGLVVKAAGGDNYTCPLTGLKPYTNYYVRAYATDASGTVYGPEIKFRSLDTWRKTTVGAAGIGYNCMKTNGDKIYLATGKGLYYSPDGGDTWTLLGFANLNVVRIGVQNSIVFAALATGEVHRSLDNGITWTRITTGAFSNLIADIFIDGDFVYVADQNAVHVSSNKGDTWSKTLPSSSGSLSFSKIVKCSNALFALDMSSNVLYKTTDNGLTWKLTPTPGGGSGIISFDCTGNTLIISNGLGAYYSTNEGQAWTKYSELPARACYLSVSDSAVFSASKNLSEFNISNSGGKGWASFTKNGITQSILLDAVFLSKRICFIQADQATLYRYRFY